MSDESEQAIDRVIAYLAHCGDPDIEAGIGALLGIGSDERIAQFREGLREVIELTPRGAAAKAPDLMDPVVVHVNMLRGTIAKPTWEHIKHLYPEQFNGAAARTSEPVDPAMTPKEFMDSILSACDASNWDADRNKGDYYRGLHDAYEAVQEIAIEYQTAIYEWTRSRGVAQTPPPRPDPSVPFKKG